MIPLRAAMFMIFCAGCLCQTCNLTKPYFESRNFFSVLHWDAVHLPDQSMLYNVQYHLYGKPCQPVPWCQDISDQVCDLTDVMSEVTSAMSVSYRAIVSVAGQCIGNVRFTPFRETILSAPEFSVNLAGTHLNITIFTPRIPWNHSIDNISSWGARQNKLTSSSVQYIVHITRPETLAKEYVSKSRSLLIWLAKPDVEYCFEVLYTLTHPGWLRPSENATYCHPASVRYPMLHILMWPGLLALLLLICLSIIFCQLRMKQKYPQPPALSLVKNETRLCLPEATHISKVEVKPEIETCFNLDELKIMDCNFAEASEEMYRPQHDLQNQSSAESSVSYSFCLHDQIRNKSSADEISLRPSDPEPEMDYSEGKNSSNTFTNNNISKNPTDPASVVLMGKTSSNGLIGNKFSSYSPQDPFSVVTNGKTNSKQLYSNIDIRPHISIPPLSIPIGNISSETKNMVPIRLFGNGGLFSLCVSDPNLQTEACENKVSPREWTPLLSNFDEKDSDYQPVHVSELMSSDYKKNLLRGVHVKEQEEPRIYMMRTERSPVVPKDFSEPDV